MKGPFVRLVIVFLLAVAATAPPAGAARAVEPALDQRLASAYTAMYNLDRDVAPAAPQLATTLVQVGVGPRHECVHVIVLARLRHAEADRNRCLAVHEGALQGGEALRRVGDGQPR